VTGIISTTPTGSESGSVFGIPGARGLSNQYFFKSQESLATVIDTVSDNEDCDEDSNENTAPDTTNESKETEKCNSPETKDTTEDGVGKVTTV